MSRARILADYVSSGDELAAVATTANAALPKAGGAMTGAITTNSTFDGIDVATRDAVHAPKASPAFTGTPTGITAAHITSGVLPVGVTGGSGLTAVPGASWVKLEETDVSGASTVTMGSASIFSSTYEMYVIIVTKMKPSGSNNSFRGKFYLSGSLIAGDKYRWQNIAYNGSTESYTAEQAGGLFDVHVNINTAIESSADNHMDSVMYLYHPASTDTLTFIEGTSVAFNNANVPSMSRFFVTNVTTGGVNVQACTGLQFFMSAGTFTAKLVVYGVKN